MARTQTLQEMVSSLRAEAGHSTSVAQGLNSEPTLKYLLKRTQEELWTAFVWPELIVRDDRPLVNGTYLYSYGVDLKFDAIREAWASSPSSATWSMVGYGIGEEKLLPGVGGANSASSNPVQLWESAGVQFRVWPTPTGSAWLRFKGNRELQPLVSNSDSSTLDATCIILFAASEMLARSKAEDAANKLQKAQRHLTKLLGNQVSAKNKVSTYGARGPTSSQRSTIIAGYP
jgi:hypothetical protein